MWSQTLVHIFQPWASNCLQSREHTARQTTKAAAHFRYFRLYFNYFIRLGQTSQRLEAGRRWEDVDAVPPWAQVDLYTLNAAFKEQRQVWGFTTSRLLSIVLLSRSRRFKYVFKALGFIYFRRQWELNFSVFNRNLQPLPPRCSKKNKPQTFPSLLERSICTLHIISVSPPRLGPKYLTGSFFSLSLRQRVQFWFLLKFL